MDWWTTASCPPNASASDPNFTSRVWAAFTDVWWMGLRLADRNVTNSVQASQSKPSTHGVSSTRSASARRELAGLGLRCRTGRCVPRTVVSFGIGGTACVGLVAPVRGGESDDWGTSGMFVSPCPGCSVARGRTVPRGGTTERSEVGGYIFFRLCSSGCILIWSGYPCTGAPWSGNPTTDKSTPGELSGTGVNAFSHFHWFFRPVIGSTPMGCLRRLK